MIIALVIATYGLTILLHESSGPFDIFTKFRQEPYLKALNCFFCTSIYCGAFFAALSSPNIIIWLIMTFTFAGGATLIDRLTMRV